MERMTKRDQNGRVTLDASLFEPLKQKALDSKTKTDFILKKVVRRLCELEDEEQRRMCMAEKQINRVNDIVSGFPHNTKVVFDIDGIIIDCTVEALFIIPFMETLLEIEVDDVGIVNDCIVMKLNEADALSVHKEQST